MQKTKIKYVDFFFNGSDKMDIFEAFEDGREKYGFLVSKYHEDDLLFITESMIEFVVHLKRTLKDMLSYDNISAIEGAMIWVDREDKYRERLFKEMNFPLDTVIDDYSPAFNEIEQVYQLNYES